MDKKGRGDITRGCEPKWDAEIHKKLGQKREMGVPLPADYLSGYLTSAPEAV